MLYLFFSATPETFAQKLNDFVVASGGAPNFYETALNAAKGANIDLNPPFSLLATLLMAPIAWTSLQWASYSAQQNGEIKGARSFQNQLVIILGSLIVTGLLLAALAATFEHAIGTNFLYVAGAGYWAGLAEGKFNGVFLWPNILAMALAGSPIIVVIIPLGYILNAFQIVNNCYIGMTRVMVAMSLDRLLPEGVSRMSDRLHTPVNAHLAYFLASIPVILVYNLWGQWTALTLGVTFACGLRRLARRGLQGGKHSNGYDLRPDRRSRGRCHGADVHVLQRPRPDQRIGLSGCVRRPGGVDHLVVLGQNGPALTWHQRGLCLQGDTARVGSPTGSRF
jgi:amino acid transporter